MDERARLLHAIEAVDAIQRYTADGREASFADGKTRDAVIRNIEILGQAVKGISDDTRAMEPDVPVAKDRRHARRADPRVLREWSWDWFGMSSRTSCRGSLERLSKRLNGEVNSDSSTS